MISLYLEEAINGYVVTSLNTNDNKKSYKEIVERKIDALSILRDKIEDLIDEEVENFKKEASL